MKKIFSACIALVFATSLVAQSGLSCDDAIPVDKNYEGQVNGPCTLWYTASTYDLPLNVHFIPVADDSNLRPTVIIDLTCDPGVYEDQKLDSIIKMAEGFDITFPVELGCDRVVKDDGTVEWDLFVDDMYREQLAEFGVTYNVTAFVQVVFKEAGLVTLKPDTSFVTCMTQADHVLLDDSISVVPNDSDRVFMMPYTDWQNDSIQFVWTGDAPAYVFMASDKCDFTPSTSSGYVWACYEVKQGEPFKLSNQAIVDAITENDGGGLFYSKVLSTSAGKLLVEKIPMQSAQGDAVIVELNKPIHIAANDNSLYCFPRTWGATQFVANTEFITKAFFSNTSEFAASETDANVLKAYAMSLVNGERELNLSSREMKALTDEATDDYIYVRFQCASPVTITAYQWSASYCADISTTIIPGERFRIAAKSSSNILRLRYDDWKGYDMSIKWEQVVPLPTYIADTCYFTLSSTNKRVVKYSSIKPKSTQVYDVATVDSWASRVDADGYLYVRLNPGAAGDITFSSTKPAEEDPVIPTSPCVASSIELKKGDQLTLNLDSAFTVYRIKYDEWVAADASLTWTGAEPLHTFVAETCTFAVAPYNKYVHAYVPVPASGNIVLDTTTLTNMAEYVDEDGYLYVRFLTEFEGTLTVQ